MSRWKRFVFASASVPLFAVALVPKEFTAQAPSTSDKNSATAWTEEQTRTDDLWADLLSLKTRASLMMVVAHPDDEDGGMLTLESRGHGVRVGLMTLNRGEGGQNSMSGDYLSALGLVRTQELLDADRYYDAEQFFSRAIDFGYSKSMRESMGNWGHDGVLYEVVRAVRIQRPLVLTSVFVGSPTDGHGQHQVAGAIAQEAFRVAGDPSVFPDQIRAGLKPWQPLRYFASVPSRGALSRLGADETGASAAFRNYVDGTVIKGLPSTDVMIDEGAVDAVLGTSYFRFAMEGLSQQKSQEGERKGELPTDGFHRIHSGYHEYASRVGQVRPGRSFFDGIDVSLTSLAGIPIPAPAYFLSVLTGIEAHIDTATVAFKRGDRSATAEALGDGLRELSELRERIHKDCKAEGCEQAESELATKQKQFENALPLALNLSVHTMVSIGGRPADEMVPGSSAAVSLKVSGLSHGDLVMSSATLTSSDRAKWLIETDQSCPTERTASEGKCWTVTAPPDAPISKPDFFSTEPGQMVYALSDPEDMHWDRRMGPLRTDLTFRFRGAVFTMSGLLRSGSPERERVVTVVPPVSVETPLHAAVARTDGRPMTIHVDVRNDSRTVAVGSVRVNLPTGWRLEPEEAPFDLPGPGTLKSISFVVTPSTVAKDAKYTLEPVVRLQGRDYREQRQPTGYGSLASANLYVPSKIELIGTDYRLKDGMVVGYLRGTGDDVPNALRWMGVNVKTLTMGDLAHLDKTKVPSVILGIRAYTALPSLPEHTQQLLEYVRSGGNLIVQYNTKEFDHDYGPYPYSLSGSPEIVVDETAPVTFLNLQSPLLTSPNHIGEEDFAHWVEERGHSFMKSWDPRYTSLLEMHDPGQEPQRGGLLVARYGNGTFTYMALALYRQLPAGVPGAYRLLANLISQADAQELLSH